MCGGTRGEMDDDTRVWTLLRGRPRAPADGTAREDTDRSTSRGLIRAAIAQQTGRTAEALRQLERAEKVFANAGMILYAATARRRRGEIMGGAAGHALVAASDAAMAERGVQAPDRFADMYAPGFQARTANRQP